MPASTLNLSYRQIGFLYRWLWRKLLHRGVTVVSRKYEYGYCKAFPFLFEPFIMAKIQAVLGVIGLLNLARFQKAKALFLREHGSYIVKTPHYQTSPFLMATHEFRLHASSRRFKPSYALPNRPEVSLRPDLLIVHNKGFYDQLK